MDDLLRSRLAAQQLLRWWAATSGAESAPAAVAPPEPSTTVATDLDGLVAGLGLDVATFHRASQPSGALGWLEPGEDLIFLRDDLAEPVRRFTLAHELGHALLHRPGGAAHLQNPYQPLTEAPLAAAAPGNDLDAGSLDPCDDADLDILMDPLAASEETLLPGQAYSARARREREANAFAGALLLPPDLVGARFLGAEGAPGAAPRTLAEQFGVSEEAVHQALAGLLLAPVATDAPMASVGRDGSAALPLALDERQRAAAAAEAPALVVAGPGTGKTTTLVGRVAHLVFERGVEPGRILALTFSNKAAREMSERVASLLARAVAP
ncbi:MAG TPA: UvrD-helicase domain-containing protein, partial [Ktedonobacterales bacterium]